MIDTADSFLLLIPSICFVKRRHLTGLNDDIQSSIIVIEYTVKLPLFQLYYANNAKLNCRLNHRKLLDYSVPFLRNIKVAGRLACDARQHQAP